MKTATFINQKIGGATLGLLGVLLLHRYYGIRHDSILYLGQLLMQDRPDVFARDLFFLYGSQDQYSLFPLLASQLTPLLSVPHLFMWGTLLGLLLFAYSSWSLLYRLLPMDRRYWSWLAVLVLPAAYGTVIVFSYGEAFLTPRIFSESLCLLAISNLLQKRGGAFILYLAAATLLHPLQALSASLIIWSWLVGQDRRWLHALWGFPPLMGLALAGIPPFTGLFHQIDAEWMQSLRGSRQLFLLEWGAEDYRVLVFDAFLLVSGQRMLKGLFGAWCLAALIGLGLGLAASLVLVDGLHLLLPTSLQVWRVHWLAHLLAISAFAALLHKHVQEHDIARALLLALLGQLVWGRMPFGWVELCAAYAAWPWIVKGARARLKPLLGFLFASILLLMLLRHIGAEFNSFVEASARIDRYPLEVSILANPLLALGLPLAARALWLRAPSSARVTLVTALLLPLTVFVALHWDGRSSQTRAVESAAGVQDIFGTPLPRDAQVFWEPESLVATWLVLGRPNYFSYSHLAGQMFNRGTFSEGRAREQRMLPLIQESARCLQMSGRGQACHISEASLRRACMTGSTSQPDYLVLPYLQPQGARGEWSVPSLMSKHEAVTFRLFSCADLMQPHGAT